MSIKKVDYKQNSISLEITLFTLGSVLKGSARKQTASFDSVLSNMKRHKIMDDQGQEPKDAQKKP